MGRAAYLQKSVLRDPKPIKARIFVQDPQFARRSRVGITEIKLAGEPWLGEGPTTSRLQVVDYDEGEEATHPPVGVLADGSGFDVGRKAPAANYKFHQVNVWATIARVLDHLESPKIFGRRIPWAFPRGRLEVRPHAGVDQNAWYDRELGAIYFFYFQDARDQTKTIYTCLSHDVVAHELGHAVLDGLKPLYNEVEAPDAGGFHEYFGDALAMTSALTMGDLVAQVVGSAPKTLKGTNLVSDIAREFGAALGDGVPYLRTAENNIKMADLEGVQEEHDYSLVLTGAFYDLLQKIYRAELARQKKHAGNRKPGQLAVAALINAASYTSRMMLRGLDYCPPAGLDYAEYARSVIRADQVAYPVDARGYRARAAAVFRRRGLVASQGALAPRRRLDNDAFRPYDIEHIRSSATDAYIFVDRNREVLGIPRDIDFHLARVYETRKTAAGGYLPPREVVLEFVWSEEVELRGAKRFGELAGTVYDLWCGGTLVFDTQGNVLHYVLSEGTRERRAKLRRYLEYMVEEGYFDAGEDALRSRVRARVSDGRLALARTAALRHQGRSRP